MFADGHLKQQVHYHHSIPVTESSSGSSVTPSELTSQEPTQASTPHQLVISYITMYSAPSIIQRPWDQDLFRLSKSPDNQTNR